MSAINQILTRTVIALGGASALVTGTAALAQSSPSPHTYATRYDAMGRVTGSIAPDPDGSGPLKHAATRTTYDQRGNPIRVETGELGSWKTESQNPHTQWPDFTVLNTAETTYDTLSRKTVDRVKGSDGITISLIQYSYDNRGRLECAAVRMNPAVYGSLPTSACVLGPEGLQGPDRITRTVYDAAGQERQIRKAVGTPIEIAAVTYSYTLNGQIAQVVDANGNRAELRYDGHDRQTRWVFPSKTRPTAFNPATAASALASAGALNEADYEEYSYDANGNRLTLRKRDGAVIGYNFDALNRMVHKGGSAVADVYYGYDLRGLQLSAVFATGGLGVTYAYDGFGRLTSETQNTDGVTRTVSSQYNANGNRTRVTYPDGQFFTYDHDGLDRATVLREGTTQLGTATFNNRGLPTQMVWTALTASANARSYGYDPAGRLASIGFDLNGTAGDVTWGYTRNPASQILTESQNNDSYAWDGHVNLTRAYTTNGLNQYESAGSAAFCYDANGNLTADGGGVYRYDVENRLVEKRAQGTGNTNCAALSYGGALQAQLYYDPTGRLYEISGGTSGVQRFAYDGNAIIGEYNSAGTMLRRYVHGSNAEADDPLIWYEGATQTSTLRRYLHSDPRGSIVAVTDHTGNRIAVNSYDEYGIPDTATGNDIATKGRFRFTGQAWIPELGMYYYKARIYSPTLGRFLQTDPIGYEDQFNLYAYVGNDPINLSDPTGLESYLVARPVFISRDSAESNGGRGTADSGRDHTFVIVTDDRGRVTHQFSYSNDDGTLRAANPGDGIYGDDRGYWNDRNNPNSGVTVARINASDASVVAAGQAVNSALGSIGSESPPAVGYAAAPYFSETGCNSNCGAFAVADLARRRDNPFTHQRPTAGSDPVGWGESRRVSSLVSGFMPSSARLPTRSSPDECEDGQGRCN